MSGPLRLVVAVAGVSLIVGLSAFLIIRTPDALYSDEESRLGPERPAGDVVIVTVEEGDGAQQIASKLEDAGVIESGDLFETLTELMGVTDELVAGDYEFRQGETAISAVQRISQGATAALVVNIREGLRQEEIGQLLERNNVVSAAAFERALGQRYQATFLADLPPGTGLEGFLFPATYGFPMDATAHDIVQQLASAFDERYVSEIQPLLAGSNLSLKDLITLAAIVEREAVVPEDRPLMASAFLNRLADGIALQADPTVQYAVAQDPMNVLQYGWWKQGLTAADLQLASPYNTYVNAGLPPGPIANPGLDSILAVLEPADTNYLYFVAGPDGKHVFAETFEEHEQNVCQLLPENCTP
jgi:UPF0755 protein